MGYLLVSLAWLPQMIRGMSDFLNQVALVLLQDALGFNQGSAVQLLKGVWQVVELLGRLVWRADMLLKLCLSLGWRVLGSFSVDLFELKQLFLHEASRFR